ncbi:dephospho-CoA kinase [Terrarubrum flagellatum]|uniref:dephospho-CoA kinase n=1 Tax=Terrirubrum flagellatum TaxID=2895980 RepID=UPI00314554DA
MFILGLTGSIGMGKSATAEMFRARGVPVHDSDAVVHALYSGAAVAPVEAAFPGVAKDGAIDRALLSQRVLNNSEAIRTLEGIVHPLVRVESDRFVSESKRAGHPLIVLDIPLLFESGGEKRCDAVVVITAPAEIQRARVLSRPGMTREKFESILAKQMPDAEKRQRAHFLVDTSLGFDSARRAVGDILRALAGRPGRAN